MIILANGKTNEVSQRTDDTGALWVRLDELSGDSGRARRHFAAAEHLAPDNWNYLRQGWTHKGTAYAHLKVLRRTNHLRKNSDKSYYDPMGLPDENHSRYTEPEWLWTPAARRVKQLLRR